MVWEDVPAMNPADIQGGGEVRYISGADSAATREQLLAKCDELAATLTLCSAFTIALLKRGGGTAMRKSVV